MLAKKTKKIAMIVVPAVCAIVAIALLVTNVIIPNSKYKDAVALMEEGKYAAAHRSFVALGDYKDSAEKAEAMKFEMKKEQIKSAAVGSIIRFGTYEQDKDESNGKEEIEWIVLAKEDNRSLVVSKFSLDGQMYNITQNDVMWETCTLRKWLNDDFFNKAFNTNEK